MKRFIAMLLTILMLFSLVACGGDTQEDKDDRDEEKEDVVADAEEEADDEEDDTEESDTEENTEVEEDVDTGVDFEAEGQQKLSDDRATMASLVETRDVWLGGQMTFALDPEPKTYEDLVEHIGCEAAYYENKPEDGERWYTWIA